MTRVKSKFSVKSWIYDAIVELVLIILFAGLVYNYTATNGQQLLLDKKTLATAAGLQIFGLVLFGGGLFFAYRAKEGFASIREQEKHKTSKTEIVVFFVIMLVLLAVGVWLFLLTVSETAYDDWASAFKPWPFVGNDLFRKSGYLSLAAVNGLVLFIHYLLARMGIGASAIFGTDDG